MVKVKINNKETELADGATLAGVAHEQNLPDRGVAVAVNNVMVPREEWHTHCVSDGDDIIILKAFCGG